MPPPEDKNLLPTGKIPTKDEIKQAFEQAKMGMSEALGYLIFDYQMTKGEALNYLGL